MRKMQWHGYSNLDFPWNETRWEYRRAWPDNLLNSHQRSLPLQKDWTSPHLARADAGARHQGWRGAVQQPTWWLPQSGRNRHGPQVLQQHAQTQDQAIERHIFDPRKDIPANGTHRQISGHLGGHGYWRCQAWRLCLHVHDPDLSVDRRHSKSNGDVLSHASWRHPPRQRHLLHSGPRLPSVGPAISGTWPAPRIT